MKRVLVLFLLLLSGSAFAGDSLYVRAAGTEVRDAGNPGGKVLTRLNIGVKVDVVGKTGNWVQIKTEVDKKPVAGWVFAPKLGADKPDKEHFKGTSATTVASASEGDTAMAIRGLSPTAENFAERTRISPDDIAAVKAMEDRKIPPEEMGAFMREGRLGEYQQ